MIYTTLNDLYYVKCFLLRWTFCTTLKDLYYVERFVQRWMICTALNDLYNVEWFVQRWMICTTLNDFYYIERFVQGWIICKIFYTNLWVDFLLIWKYQEEIYLPLSQKLVIKRCFWSLQWKLLLSLYFPDIFNNFLNKSDAPLCHMI